MALVKLAEEWALMAERDMETITNEHGETNYRTGGKTVDWIPSGYGQSTTSMSRRLAMIAIAMGLLAVSMAMLAATFALLATR